MMSKKWLLALCASGFAISAWAAGTSAPANPEEVVRKAVEGFADGVTVDSITPAPFPGFYQVIASGQLVYVSADGKYMMNGDLIDVASKKNLNGAGWARFRKAELAKVPAADRIVFAPPHPKYTVTVFTDVSCGYCRALHQHIADFNKEGIAVEYLAWPRDGVTGEDGRPTAIYKEMVSVWCAADRQAAFSAAKQGKAPKSATCTNPVKDEFDLGLKLGVTGTPTVLAEDGSVIGGYLTPEDMLEAVKKHSGG
jgi:thiol:disulfide interchange protein DsbC